MGEAEAPIRLVVIDLFSRQRGGQAQDRLDDALRLDPVTHLQVALAVVDYKDHIRRVHVPVIGQHLTCLVQPEVLLLACGAPHHYRLALLHFDGDHGG